jgi:hypothetical protein
LVIVSLFLLASCVGTGSQNGGALNGGYKNAYQALVGTSRDSVIAHYGAPNRTAKLDKGGRIMEYRTSIRYFLDGRHSKRYACTLRFWYQTTTITRIDDIGYRPACERFLFSRERNAKICEGSSCLDGD